MGETESCLPRQAGSVYFYFQFAEYICANHVYIIVQKLRQSSYPSPLL